MRVKTYGSNHDLIILWTLYVFQFLEKGKTNIWGFFAINSSYNQKIKEIKPKCFVIIYIM